MSRTIQISDTTADLLAEQAAARGISLTEWLEVLARENAKSAPTSRNSDALAAAEGIRAIRQNVKPDPDGWTARDYINFGRR